MKLLLVVIQILELTRLITCQSGLWDTYASCRSKLGDPSWLCDPNGKISSKETVDRLDNLLWRLQTDVPCYCANGDDCYRYANVSIQSGVVGVLIVTTHLPTDAGEEAKRIYDDANLAASKTCDNGLLIVYAMDDQKLYVLRGNATQQTLFAAESDALLDRVTETLQTQDYKSALPALLEQYISRLQGNTYERQRNWETIVGVVVGAAIVAFAAAVIGGVCFARYCAKKKSLSSPPPPPIFARKQEKVKAALRRVKRRQNRAIARHKTRTEKSRTLSGRPVSPKRLASAKRRLFRKQNRRQRELFEQQQQQHQQQRALLTPSSGSEEQYYLISEPGSAIYAPYAAQATLRAGASGGESPYATGTMRPSSTSGYQPPAILYPDSQAVFNHPPSPKRETQRRDFYVYDEESKEIYDAPAR